MIGGERVSPITCARFAAEQIDERKLCTYSTASAAVPELVLAGFLTFAGICRNLFVYKIQSGYVSVQFSREGARKFYFAGNICSNSVPTPCCTRVAMIGIKTRRSRARACGYVIKLRPLAVAAARSRLYRPLNTESCPDLRQLSR